MPTGDNDDVLIAGGGIGGLTLALCLHAHGVGCRVFEASREIRPLGVGINLLPHAVRVLRELDLEDRLAQTAVATAELAYYNRHGQLIWSEPRGVAAGYRFPQLSLHRGVLQQVLLDAVRERLGVDSVATARAVCGVRELPEGVEIDLRDGRDGHPVEPARGRLLVGADGIHSAVRALLHPTESGTRYSGRMLWRSVTQADPFLTGRTMIMAGYQDCKFVCYPITPPDGDGRQTINWIAELPVADDGPSPQDWSRIVSPDLFRDAFAEWRFDWLDIPALIDGAKTVYEYPLADRDPLERWGTDRVTLLGDAAHPMYPIGSNGASQAILDAAALAASPDFATYEAERRPATSQIVLLNRQNGPEQVMQLAEERAPEGFADVHEVIPAVELEGIAARYKRAAGFAPEQLR